MKKILITTDFSIPAENAFRYGLHLAEQLGARVTLLHVFNKANLSESDIPQNFRDALESGDEERSLKYLEVNGEYIQKSQKTNVPIHYILEEGNPSDRIAAFGEFMDANLIILGNNINTKKANLLNVWLGNVVNLVLKKTKRPVLVVPGNVSFVPLDHVVYATNFEEKKQRVPRELALVTAPFSGKISCVHVRKPSEKYMDEIYFELYKDIYQLEMDNFNIRFYTITQKNIIEGLDRFIEERDVKLLAMLKNKHLTVVNRLFGPALTEQMSFHSRLPLLILQE